VRNTLRQYIFRESTINFITNAFFNGVIAWFLLRGGSDLTMWGEHSFAIDLMATSFVLLFIVTLIVIPLQRRKVLRGDIAGIRWQDNLFLHRQLQRFPDSAWRCGVLIGAIGLLFFIPLTLLPMSALGINHFTPEAYAVFKGLWAGLIAGLMMGPMILLGLATTSKDMPRVGDT
jgi:hypothetical protein